MKLNESRDRFTPIAPLYVLRSARGCVRRFLEIKVKPRALTRTGKAFPDMFVCKNESECCHIRSQHLLSYLMASWSQPRRTRAKVDA